MRPVVVSLRTGMLPAFQPFFPPVTVRIDLWTKFIVFKAKSLGMSETVVVIEALGPLTLTITG